MLYQRNKVGQQHEMIHVTRFHIKETQKKNLQNLTKLQQIIQCMAPQNRPTMLTKWEIKKYRMTRKW